MAKICHLDFETFSACELKDRGLANYADDLSTGVHCMAYAFDDGAVELWTPAVPPPLAVFEHVQAGKLVYAHNASFELAIWRGVMTPSYDWPRLTIEQTRCTMAQAYAMGLPGALENAAPALGIAQRKDAVGKRVMLQLAKPKNMGGGYLNGEWQQPWFWKPEDDPVKFQQLYAYCIQDVEVERALHHRMMELSADEQRVWQLDQKINNRGVRVDLPSIDKAIALVEVEQARLNAEMLRTTGGVVGKCTEVQLLVKWIRSQGVEMGGLAKADVLDALEGDLPPQVERALQLRREAAKSSTAKLVAMKERASIDGRVRGIHQYHGAATGRWAGRGIQIQNFPRGSLRPQDVADAIDHLHDRDYLDVMYGQPMDVVASSLRGFIQAGPGKRLVVADYSNIEGRVGAWLAGEQWKIQAFEDYDAGTGPDIYKLAYARSFGKRAEDVAKDERQIGKVMELALQYAGGVGAFQTMARGYGVKVPDERADELKVAWREAHPAIVKYWYALEEAAMNAVMRGGTHAAGRVRFKMSGSFLWARLPSGRCLCYPYPKIVAREVPWGGTRDSLAYMSVNGLTNKWEETATYHGKIFENLCQAVARDVLACGMANADAAGYPVTGHIHDELVTEVQDGRGSADELGMLMCELPAWAEGLPVAAEGYEALRFRK